MLYPTRITIPPYTGRSIHAGDHIRQDNGTVRWVTACGIDYTNVMIRHQSRDMTCRACKVALGRG